MMQFSRDTRAVYDELLARLAVVKASARAALVAPDDADAVRHHVGSVLDETRELVDLVKDDLRPILLRRAATLRRGAKLADLQDRLAVLGQLLGVAPDTRTIDKEHAGTPP